MATSGNINVRRQLLAVGFTEHDYDNFMLLSSADRKAQSIASQMLVGTEECYSENTLQARNELKASLIEVLDNVRRPGNSRFSRLLHSIKRTMGLSLAPEQHALERAIALFAADRGELFKLAAEAVAESQKPVLYQFLGNLKSDRDFLLEVIKHDAFQGMQISADLRSDKEFFLAACQVNPYAADEANRDIRDLLLDDREFALAAVKIAGLSVFYIIGKAFKGDREFISAGLNSNNSNPSNLALVRHVAPYLEDRDLILELMERWPEMFSRLKSNWKNDEEVAWLACSKISTCIRNAGETVKANPAFFKRLLQIDPNLSLIESFTLPSPEDFKDKNTEMIRQKIRNKEVQTALLKIYAIYREEYLDCLNSFKPPLIAEYQLIALSLLCPLQTEPHSFKKVVDAMANLKGRPLRLAIKDSRTGLLQSLLELIVLKNPPLDFEELDLFFQGMPKDEKGNVSPIDLRKEILYIQAYLSTKERYTPTLKTILQEPFASRITKLKEPIIEIIRTFGVENPAPIIESARAKELLTYLRKHLENNELRPSISRLLQAIVNDNLKEERYQNNRSIHIQKIADEHPMLWEKWERFDFSSSLIKAEVATQKSAPFSFQEFLNDKMQHGHLPQELVDSLTEGESKAEHAKGFEECLGYLNECIFMQGSLENEKITRGIALFTQSYPDCEFINDLKSLLPKQAEQGRLIQLSDDWETLLACGTDVLGSCQGVDGDPGLNKCLLAYILDGKNRILCVKDDKNKIVGRVLLRLLLKENDEPALFMERYYGDQNYQVSIKEAAKKISMDLGLELYEEGAGKTLRSLGTSSDIFYEYSDAARDTGSVTTGVFSHLGELVT